MSLRLETTLAGYGRASARWHYTVRFVVRGHWRHLRDLRADSYPDSAAPGRDAADGVG